jgi:hypothetical protein
MARNSRETGIVIFTCVTNLKCLSSQIKEIFIDGTFKCCPKFFLQLYTIHGCENGNYVPLVFLFYGLPYLATEAIKDFFVMDIMSSVPDDAKCHQFADYMLENYMSSDARSQCLFPSALGRYSTGKK